MQTLYLKLDKNKVNPYVIFSGDPSRVKRIASLLDKSIEVANNREFVTYSGVYWDVPVTITSTGIGGPSTAIAMEEMYECGMKVAIRIGTVMGLKNNLGKYIIPIGSMRRENTSKEYIEASYPAVSDPNLVLALNKSADSLGVDYDNGLICSMDRFYGHMKYSKLSKEQFVETSELFNELRRYNIRGIDMESGTILTLANLMGIKGAVVTLTTVTQNLDEVLTNREDMDNKMLKIVLDGIVNYHNNSYGKGFNKEEMVLE